MRTDPFQEGGDDRVRPSDINQRIKRHSKSNGVQMYTQVEHTTNPV